MNDVLIKTPEVEAQSPKSNPPSDASNIVNDIIEKHIEKEFIVASKNLKVKKPWKLVKSSRYNGMNTVLFKLINLLLTHM